MSRVRLIVGRILFRPWIKQIRPDRPNLSKICPDLAELGPELAQIGPVWRIRATCAQIRVNFDQSRPFVPGIGEVGPNSTSARGPAKVAPNQTNFDHELPGVGQTWPKLALTCVALIRIWLALATSLAKFGEIRPRNYQICTDLDQSWPEFGHVRAKAR